MLRYFLADGIGLASKYCHALHDIREQALRIGRGIVHHLCLRFSDIGMIQPFQEFIGHRRFIGNGAVDFLHQAAGLACCARKEDVVMLRRWHHPQRVHHCHGPLTINGGL
jgi:hypothetical protein